ncbi:pupal cuticle protein 36 [Anastrepha obliqua]|uniref:pupal cuticle protein 36 n=1 Tax=Anastrepha obliqua TaxID=95512 RepID=UPI0024094B6C|nr:pupal cuticle protein 36 [Anastrepha obliqua]
MRGFIVLCLSAVALAAPQGYNYNQGSAGGIGGGAGGAGLISHGQGGFSQFGQSSSSGGSFFHGGSVGAGGAGVQQGFFNHGGSQQQQPAVVSKRFFIHTAPEDADEQYQEKHITVGVPRKNYNVVFIKSPNRAHKKASIKITPAINEDKTVIYVLNKKTDGTDIDAQVLEQPAVTTKPEVFFIKYKTAEEAQHAQQEIQAQYDALGGSSQVTDEGVAPVSSVIGSLGGGDGAGAGAFAGAGAGAGAFAGAGAGAGAGIGGGHGGHGGSNAYLPPNFK